MKWITVLFCLCFAFHGISLAQHSTEVSEVGKGKFEADLRPGGRLRMDLCSGEIRISGVDENKIRVHYDGPESEDLKDVKVTFKNSDASGDLRVSGCPHNNFNLTVEIPKTLDLYIRIPFGDAEIRGVTGNKDVELHAGDLTVDVGNASDYGHVDASISSGGLDADPFEVNKGGLFRSFTKEGGGKYRLHAHVGAGQLTLR